MAKLNVTVTAGRTIQGLAQEIRSLGRFDKRSFHDKAGKHLVGKIKQSVQRDGRDITGKPFSPLSKWTERSIRPKPRKGQKKLGTQVRGPGHILTDTGKMLRAIQSVASQRNAVISFRTPGAERIAGYHHFGTKPATVVGNLRIPVVMGGALKPPARGKARASRVGAIGGSTGVFTRRATRKAMPQRRFFGIARYAGRDDAGDIAKIAERMIQAEARRKNLLAGVA